MAKIIAYDVIVRTEAMNLIQEIEDTIVDGLVDDFDFDRLPRGEVDRRIDETLIEREYSTGDAVFILENGSDVEIDNGLFEGMSPFEAIKAQAAYTFTNDVRHRCGEQYNRLLRAVDEAVDDVNISVLSWRPDEMCGRKVAVIQGNGIEVLATFDDNGEFVDTEANADPDPAGLGAALERIVRQEDGEPNPSDVHAAVRRAFAEMKTAALVGSADADPIVPASDEERRILGYWLWEGRSQALWGFPLGSAYIGTGAGYGTENFTHVWYDNELGNRAPHLRGLTRSQAKAYWEFTFGEPQATNAEEMLAKLLARMRNGAGREELEDLIPEIEAIMENQARPTFG